jgi:acyl dehydratase
MAGEELGSAPALLGLYVRALAPRRAVTGAPVPERRVVLREVPVDRDHLRRYAEVCGFRDRERLPVTYPHLVAFPLAMSLMTRKDFPFPLLGLVHIANRIEQHRPIAAADRLSYEVWIRQPYEHPRGTAFEVVAEAADGDGPAWWSVSTYLRRGGTPDRRAPHPEPPDEIGDAAVIDRRWEVPASTGRAYATVSGDRNPIHLHPLTARLFGFPRALAHGMWTKARCLAALDDVLPDAFTTQTVFRAPLLLPATVRFRAALDAPGWAFDICGAESGRRHLRGSVSPFG